MAESVSGDGREGSNIILAYIVKENKGQRDDLEKAKEAPATNVKERLSLTKRKMYR